MKNYFLQSHDILNAYYTGTVDYVYHLHSSIEVVYCINGSGSAFLDGKEYTVGENEAFVVFPNQLHKYEGFKNGRFIIFIVPRNEMPYLSEITGDYKPLNPVICDGEKEILGLLSLLIDSYRNCSEKSLRLYLELILSRIIEKSGKTDKEKNSEVVTKILNFCQENYSQDISLEDISEKFGLSKGYLSHIFSGKLKINFRNYINDLRISAAKALIEQNKLNFTEISIKTGFSTTRTFNRAFLKSEGITPMEYKKSNGKH